MDHIAYCKKMRMSQHIRAAKVSDICELHRRILPKSMSVCRNNQTKHQIRKILPPRVASRVATNPKSPDVCAKSGVTLEQLEHLYRETVSFISDQNQPKKMVDTKISQLQSAIKKSDYNTPLLSTRRKYKLHLTHADVQRISELSPPDSYDASPEAMQSQSHNRLIHPILSDCSFTVSNTLRPLTNYRTKLAGKSNTSYKCVLSNRAYKLTVRSTCQSYVPCQIIE